MEINDVENLLKGTQYEPFIGSLQKITFKDYVYSDLLKIGNNDLGYFALKIRQNDKKNIIDSISCLKTVNDIEDFINKYTGIIEKEKHIITISEWLNGEQPIDTNKHQLPIFFSKLAVLNKNNIVRGPYTSMYLDWNYFNSADELINWEINYHKKYFFEGMDVKIIMEIIENIKHGISCMINEDMNAGNMFVTNDGKYKIIDTEWVIKGINLYQFQHIDYFGFNKNDKI